MCVALFLRFVSYQASDWWLRCPKASSYADSGPFTQLDRCFWDGLKYPFSFLLLQFGTGIAVDRFQGQQEGGRCVGHKHSMKDLEPWLMWEATWSWSWRYSLSQQKKQWKLRWNPVPKVSSDSEFPHLLLVELVFHDGYHMFQLSCYHPTSATAGSGWVPCWIMGRQGGTEDKLGMTLDDVIRVQVRVPRSMPWCHQCVDPQVTVW